MTKWLNPLTITAACIIAVVLILGGIALAMYVHRSEQPPPEPVALMDGGGAG